MAPTHLLFVLYYNKLCGGQGRADKELQRNTRVSICTERLAGSCNFSSCPLLGEKKKKKKEIVIAPFPSSHALILLTPLITVGGTLFFFFKCLFLNLEKD